MTGMRGFLKRMARLAALAAALPWLAMYALKSVMLGRDRALEGSSQSLSLVPGLTGQYLRRAFLSRAIGHCSSSATVEFGVLFSQAGTRLDDNVYIGPRCQIGLAHLERDVLLAAGVHVPSGGATHGTSEIDVSIRDQEGTRTLVRIGEGTWVGSNAVVMADVGRHCIVGAGAVVTRPIPDFAVAAGVPARVIKDRRAAAAPA